MGILSQRHPPGAGKLINSDLIHLGSWTAPRECDVGVGTLRTGCGLGKWGSEDDGPQGAQLGAHLQQMLAP